MYWRDRNTITVPTNLNRFWTEECIKQGLAAKEVCDQNPVIPASTTNCHIVKCDDEPGFLSPGCIAIFPEDGLCGVDMSPWGVADHLTFDEMVHCASDRLCSYVETFGPEAVDNPTVTAIPETTPDKWDAYYDADYSGIVKHEEPCKHVELDDLDAAENIYDSEFVSEVEKLTELDNGMQL